MKCLNVSAIEDIILVDVLDFKKPERAGEYCRGLATRAAEKIAQEVHLPADGPSIKAIQHAYALLWRDMAPKSREVQEARAVLLAALTKDQQREAIGWIQDQQPVTEAEVMALIIDDHSAPEASQ